MRIGAISAEAGIQGSTESGHAEVPASTPASEEIENGGPSSSARPDSGVPRAEGSSGGSSKHAIEQNMMMLARGKRLHFSGYGDSLPHGDVVPQTPVSVAGDILDAPVESMMSPAKASKHGVNLIRCHLQH